MTTEMRQQSIKIAERLRELRNDANIKRKDVVTYLGINIRTYMRYECDTEYSVDFKRNLGMPMRHLIRLARLYNCSTDYILGLSDEKETAR